MPTAVLDLDLAQPLPVLSLPERYDRALVLIRLYGHPVGRAWLQIADGRLMGADLQVQLLEAAGWQLWECWLYHRLAWDAGTPPDVLPQATVAICTRDRPQDVQRCLEALMNLPDDGQELLVVDNCPSTEDTRHVVASFEGRVGYIREDRPGLDVARNRALREASHDIVAFTDDDAAPESGWLRALLRNWGDPMVACVTGLTMPLELETEAQEWFERYSPFGRGFRHAVFDKDTINPLAAGRTGAGANMALRRSLLDRIGLFDEALDGGTPTCSGGDTEMFSRILAAGYRIVYEPRALSWHRHRRTWKELRQTTYGYGVGAYAVWTRRLLFEREIPVLRLAWNWFWRTQLPALARSLLRRPEAIPLDLCVAELRGCAAGPWAYLSARRQRNRQNTNGR